MLRIIHYSLIRIYVKPFSWSEKIEEMLHKKTIILLQKINPFLSAIDRKGFFLFMCALLLRFRRCGQCVGGHLRVRKAVPLFNPALVQDFFG